jgi:hypothetical protein
MLMLLGVFARRSANRIRPDDRFDVRALAAVLRVGPAEFQRVFAGML